MATKLSIFNGALMALGERRLTDTGEDSEPARELAVVYDQVVEECLSVGSWNFAVETIMADADTGVVPEFGYAEVFAKPDDWLRTVAVSQDPYFNRPLLHYIDDVNYWSADSTPIYIRYVSHDTGIGLELTRWTAHFSRYVELELAARVGLRLTQNASLVEAVNGLRDKARKTALNRDSMDEAQPKFPPPGNWTLARGAGASRRDRGPSGTFTG